MIRTILAKQIRQCNNCNLQAAGTCGQEWHWKVQKGLYKKAQKLWESSNISEESRKEVRKVQYSLRSW